MWPSGILHYKKTSNELIYILGKKEFVAKHET